MTSDSQHPLYRKGYQHGRARTEAEINVIRSGISHASKFNAAFIALLPTAMEVHDWSIGSKIVKTSEERVELCRLWAEMAAKVMK